MKKYNAKNPFFSQKIYSNPVIFDYFSEKNISILAQMFEFIFDRIDLDFLKNISKSNKRIGGRPPLNYLGCIKILLLSICRHLSLRDLAKQDISGSEYRYLYGEDKIFPKSSVMVKIAKLLDGNIDNIFEQILKVIENDIGMDKKTLYCDGTVYEAHNSRHKVIRIKSILQSKTKWENKLNTQSLPDDEKTIAEMKLKKWSEREKKLLELNRNSYGLIDNDCILLKDKDGSFIAGYNVQLIEEAKHGLIIDVYISNVSPDRKAFLAIQKEILTKHNPSKFVFDTGYDDPKILELFYDNNVEVVTLTRKHKFSDGKVINELSFELTEDGSGVICPNNRILKATKVKNNAKYYDTRFASENCDGCQLKARCCKKGDVNKILQLYAKEYKILRENKAIIETENGQIIYSHRSNICESPNGFMKCYLQGKKLKRIGLKAANTTIKTLALAYNLTRYYNIKNKA